MESFTTTVTVTTAIILAIAAGIIYVSGRLARRASLWPKMKQYKAYTQKVTPVKTKVQVPLNSLSDFIPVGEKEPVHDVPTFFASRGNEFSAYSMDWEQEAVVLIRPVDGTDLKKHPFFREAQRLNAAEVLIIPFEQLQDVVDTICDKVAHVQEVFVYMTGRTGSTLLIRAVDATSVAQAVNEPDVITVIAWEVHQLRRSRQSAKAIPAILLDGETFATLLRNVVTLLNYYLVTSDRRHRSVIFYKLKNFEITVSDVLFRACPSSKTVFWYRNGVEFLESWSRVWLRRRAFYVLYRAVIQLGLCRWAPGLPGFLRSMGDDAKFLDARGHGSHYHYAVALWVGAMIRALELQKKHFFHAVIYYTALVREKEEIIRLLFEKIGLELSPEDQGDGLKTVFLEDSQAGTHMSSRTSTPGEKWVPYSSSSAWMGDWEREYISYLARHSGNETLGADFIIPDTIV